MTQDLLDGLSKIKDRLVEIEEELNKLKIKEPVVADLLTNLISMITHRIVTLRDDDFFICPDCGYKAISTQALKTHIGAKHDS